MPYLSVTTNAALTPESESVLAAEASRQISGELGKPQAYVMVSVQTIRTLNFGSSEEPAAFIQLKSIGLPLNLNSVASRLTDLMVTHAGLKPGRVFITFADVPPSRWAHDGATFA